MTQRALVLWALAVGCVAGDVGARGADPPERGPDGQAEDEALDGGAPEVDGAPALDAGVDPLAECRTAPIDLPASEAQVGAVEVSVSRGLYAEPFDVVLSTATAGARIRYTIDGSDPALGGGSEGDAPVVLGIGTTTVLRAVALREGMLPSRTHTSTYLFLDDVLRQPAEREGYPQPELEVGETVLPLDYGMDPEVVDPDPDRVRRALEALPSISLVLEADSMFGEQGIYRNGGSGANAEWEVPVSIEILYPRAPERDFQLDAAVRPHTHQLLKRSFKLKFKAEYGPTKVTSCLMREAPLNGELAQTRFDTWILRGGTNRNIAFWCNPDDSTYTEDQWVRDTQLAAGGVGARGTYVHLYINGMYWGLYNLVERPDEDFTSAYLGGDKEDWFAINHGGVVGGDSTRWDHLVNELAYQDMSDSAAYQELTEYLDVDAFIDYVLINWYAGTDDWPDNNWYAGNRNEPPGPIRFFVWDADEVWDGRCEGPGDPLGRYGAWVKPEFRADASGGPPAAAIWHAARTSPVFMERFVARADELLFGEGALTEASSIARWRTLTGAIADAFVAESARWGDARGPLGERTRTVENMWQPTVDRMIYERIPGNVDRMIEALRAEGYYP